MNVRYTAADNAYIDTLLRQMGWEDDDEENDDYSEADQADFDRDFYAEMEGDDE